MKGISTGEFQEALTALLGRDAPGLSASTISRLKAVWQEDHAHWSRRDLSNRRYVYLWVDGIHFGVRLEDAAQCILVVIGATADGKKELLALGDGYREREASWREVLLDLKARGLSVAPHLATGDGALGFWKALPEFFGTTQGQRCWVNKTQRIEQLPKSQQPKAKVALKETWMAATRQEAEGAFDQLLTLYRPKYPKAAECLEKIGGHCWPSTIFRPSTRSIFGPRIQSNLPSPRSGYAPTRPAAACLEKAFWRWYSCW